MSALQRGWIVALCLALALPAQAQQRYQLAPLGFALDGIEVDLPRPSRPQWRAVLSAMFPPPPGADHRSLQRDMLVDGHGRRQDVAGAFDLHGLSEAPQGRWRWADLEWKPPGEGDQYLSIAPISAATPLEAIARMTAAALNGSPCGPLPVIRLGRLLPARRDIPAFAVECRGPVPNEGGGTGYSGGVAAVAAIADGLALSYAAHGPRAGARHIDRFQALVATLRPDAPGGRQALNDSGAEAAARRFGPALQARAPQPFASLSEELWERGGPLNTRLCHAKWGAPTSAVTCLRVFPAGGTPDALLSRHLLVDAWECNARIVRRLATADQATAQIRCENAAKVGGVATRVYVVRRDPADGRLVFAATYGKAQDLRLIATNETADLVITEVLTWR